MGTFKKEKSRAARTGGGSSKGPVLKTGNLHVKGENFYRDAAKVKKLNMLKSGRAQRNARGDITKAAALQSTDAPVARVDPNRRWFGNTRVISQDALEHFREAVKATQNDSFQVLMKRNKLPMSLVEESTRRVPTVDITQTESYASTFGPKQQRRKPRLAVADLAELAEDAGRDGEQYAEREREQVDEEEYASANRDSIFSKGQSRRIWNELYKVIDSSDVVIHVLDARDPEGTRCRIIEHYIKKEAPHKHLIFVMNKCDLVPTWVSVSTPKTPALSQGAARCRARASVTTPGEHSCRAGFRGPVLGSFCAQRGFLRVEIRPALASAACGRFLSRNRTFIPQKQY